MKATNYRLNWCGMVIVLGFFTACSGIRVTPTTSKLSGDWTTGSVKTEWGLSTFELSFFNDSEMEFRWIPPEGRKGISTKGTYSIVHGKLTSSALGKGEPVAVWFEGKQLFIQAGEETPMQFMHK